MIQSLIAQKISSRHIVEELTDKLYSCENAKQKIKTELMQTKEKARQELKKKVQMSLLLYNIAVCVIIMILDCSKNSCSVVRGQSYNN